VLIVPLVALVALAIDLNLIFQIMGFPGKKLLIGIIALCIGIAWIIFRSLQWATNTPDAAAKKLDISKLAEIKPEKFIVVLPFADLSPQKDEEYFCDGMTEEIISHLSHVRDLLVISRSSAMTFRGTKKTIPEIARAVNVRYVLKGSVRKAGNSLRIAAQLIDPSTDAHLWAEKYSGPLDDVFDIQEKVSSSIVDALKVKLQPGEKQRRMDRPIENVAAYDLHIRACHEIWRGTEQGLETAPRLIEKGFDVVGDNEILYADMGLINIMYIDAGIKSAQSIKLFL